MDTHVALNAGWPRWGANSTAKPHRQRFEEPVRTAPPSTFNRPQGREDGVKRIVEVNEGGFDAMLGEKIQVWCGVYIYAGTLAGVNDDHIELKDAYVVYETGELGASQWKDAQPIKGILRVMKHAIESWSSGR
jgi:hypothetical protein